MDAEGPAVAGPFDLVASSMALQWTADLGRALAGLGRLVRPAGRLALAVPGAETFREWRAALQGRACGVPDFPDMDGLRRLVPPGFSADLAEERRIVDYGSALAFLRALKAMGAAQPRPGHRPLDPGALRAGLSRLDDAGPRLTWHILYAVLRKDPD
jgi:malonyl-CoA O-methyltransferase